MSRTSRKTRARCRSSRIWRSRATSSSSRRLSATWTRRVEAAKQFPDVKFEHCTGYKHADNLGTYNSRFHQGRAVEGTIAGLMSKSGVDRLSRLVQGAGGGAGRERLHARRAGGEPEGHDQARHDRLVVRSGQGSRGGPDPHQPRLRRHRPAHRQPGRPAGLRAAQGLVLRQRRRHVALRAEDAADRDRGHLGALLHLARQGDARRDLEAGRRLVGHEGRHRRHRALQQGDARQREGRGRQDHRRLEGRLVTTSSPARSPISPARSASPRASA